jgi:malonate transporter MadL subunit
MILYGVAILAFSYLSGQFLGEVLGKYIGVNANVGGVGFAMIILMLLSDWLIRKGKWDTMMEQGIQFWNQMYIPIVVAMAATQNVRVAVSSGLLAVLAGIVPVILCIALIPAIARYAPKSILPS